ncbi:MAG: PfkB family carbohydrate kinase [Verrucomicrobiia bacterium]
MTSLSLPLRARDVLLANCGIPASTKALLGLDGFIDLILHVVKTRTSETSYERFTSMSEWGQRIKDAEGLSANFEFVPQIIKLGGNGPIMANALLAMGFPVTYIGNLGWPDVHPIFVPFASRADVISIADPGTTDAVEFDNGKLMLGKYQSLRDLNWDNILERVGLEKLTRVFEQSRFVALVNWTMIDSMSDIFRHLLDEVAPKLAQRQTIFFDLADPAKRSREDIAEALALIGEFENFFDVILGLNMGESRQIGEVLGIPAPPQEMEPVRIHACRIREALNVNTVVIHPIPFAAAANKTDSAAVAGPHTAHPKITTGAGDHFNAGFCLGQLLGASLEESLQIAVATSGFYVRNAQSPSLEDLAGFLSEL